MINSKFVQYYFALKHVWELHNSFEFGQTPPIPSVFSEQLCRQLLDLQEYEGRDFDAQDSDGRTYEIKATGTAKGQTTINLNKKFDYLIWLHISFTDDNVFTYKIPKDYFPKPKSKSREAISLSKICRKNSTQPLSFDFYIDKKT